MLMVYSIGLVVEVYVFVSSISEWCLHCFPTRPSFLCLHCCTWGPDGSARTLVFACWMLRYFQVSSSHIFTYKVAHNQRIVSLLCNAAMCFLPETIYPSDHLLRSYLSCSLSGQRYGMLNNKFCKVSCSCDPVVWMFLYQIFYFQVPFTSSKFGKVVHSHLSGLHVHWTW